MHKTDLPYYGEPGIADALQAARDPDEEGDYMAFEQLMADAAIKKDKKDTKKDKKEHKKDDEVKKESHTEQGIPSHIKDNSTTKATA